MGPLLKLHRGEAMTPVSARCPQGKFRPDGTEHTIEGCGSTNVFRDLSEESLYECLDCGLSFDPQQELGPDLDHLVISTGGWECDVCGVAVNGQTDEFGRTTINGDNVFHTP